MYYVIYLDVRYRYIFVHALSHPFCLYHSSRETITMKSSMDRKVYGYIGLKLNEIC